MAKQYTASEIEKKVYNHIIKETSKGYTFDFNPLNVSKEGIADKLNLEEEEVEEALASLSGQNSDKGSKLERIESIKPRFEIWLPKTNGGKDIKDALCESGLAVKGNLNILYSFLFLVVIYIFIFEVPYIKNFLGLINPVQYFIWAVIFTAISVPLGNYLAMKWYQANLLIQRVKGSKYYIYFLIVLIAIILISVNKEWNLGIILSSLGAGAEIILVIYQITKDNKNDKKHHK